MPDGTEYRVIDPDSAVRAANQPPTTREEVEKFGGEFGRVVDGKWVADATADIGTFTSPPPVDGVTGAQNKVASGLSNKVNKDKDDPAFGTNTMGRP